MAASFVSPVLEFPCKGTSDDKCQSKRRIAGLGLEVLFICEFCDNMSAGLGQVSQFQNMEREMQSRNSFGQFLIDLRHEQ